jgi:hypothetical protein
VLLFFLKYIKIIFVGLAKKRQTRCYMEKNIFDAVGKMARSKKKETASNPLPQAVPKKLLKIQVNTEIQDMLQKMQEMSDDLENQLNMIYRKGKESKINVSILENPGQLSKNQFEQMEKQKSELIEKIIKVIPPKSCLKKKQKSKEQLTQERKGKLRGARNKWIPVK